ncbi:TetR/AcrR family transcriptional regulator (plasmid) [Lichenicola cladoniae]|uniref:TetR/AcrR family transcriptional regulator n=1 Tax=Lichenicola cladoniae TaxID=1484109 RepID=A0A6M8HYH3_9PROT|nr:TetR/AcrR family transcriptional regulator [Acetobacteraceae bacterium]QKE93583.1 TetR/AcrR family transcriptional regulator [Lichenicola cladoniae]
MRFPPAETAEKHEKILNESSRLFRERGLSGVSVGDLMKAADLTHGSFYNHFASKQDLVAECVAHVCALAEGQIELATPTGAGKRAFVAKYLSVAARDNPGRACLMSSLGPEIAREPTVRPAMTQYVYTFVAKLATHFPWPRTRDARRDAIRMTASMVGALVLARAVDDEALSREILLTVTRQLTQNGEHPAD